MRVRRKIAVVSDILPKIPTGILCRPLDPAHIKVFARQQSIVLLNL